MLYMDLDKLFDKKNITASSKNLYMKNLARLNGGKPIKNMTFLKDHTKIEELLSKYKENTKRSYYISIVSLLKGLCDQNENSKVYKKLYHIYFEKMEQLNKSLKTNNEKTEKEKENWISQEEVLEKLESLKGIVDIVEKKKKLNEEEFHRLQNLLVLSLYALQKPRRNRDYQDMLVYKKAPVHYAMDIKGNMVDLLSPHNILDLKGNQFIFTNFKTAKKYSNQEISIDPSLRQTIDLYLKFHPTFRKSKEPVQLLVDFNGEAYKNNNDMTRILYKIFDKKIGVNMLRHIYLTDKYKDAIGSMKKDAEEMGTSVEMVKDQYVKTDDVRKSGKD